MIQRNSHRLKINWEKVVDCCGLSSLMGDGSELEKNPPCTVSVTIREAQLQDIKALSEVLTLSFHPAKGWLSFLQPILKLGVYEDLRSRLRGTVPYYCCLVAVETTSTLTNTTEKIIGTIELSLKSGFNSHYLYISNLAVIQSHRRQGIAKQLLQQCEEIASKWGHNTLNLHVLDENYVAKKLYLSNGYQVSETELTWPSLPLFRSQRLLLKKHLNPHV
ncbi:GNAT family N-acetyltransferase [Cyanothece sp. BG0011]|uniref:GNAT family N-acetyltransferase n=1 Tax=Cyanothece sp. BG0011 TaxID=2082950 RepID=UPI000D1FC3C7|nr:GNAT family N-acetyltransferase [Cyanothece sp. BG0011]